jgi:citrate synthase
MLLVLHADHEQNCSTSTVRMVASSQANLYASIAAGVNALWGPLHGGANQAVIEMLEQIAPTAATVKDYVPRSRTRRPASEAHGLRAPRLQELRPARAIIKKAADNLLDKMHIQDPKLDLAASSRRRRCPTTTSSSGSSTRTSTSTRASSYKAIGFPIDMFTVMFAIGRMPGWIARSAGCSRARESLHD